MPAGQPWLTLRFTTAASFLAQAEASEAAVDSREHAGSRRPIEADRLLTLDHTIETTFYRVKDGLTSTCDKKKAATRYATVGIGKAHALYMLPAERSQRAAALLTSLKTEKSTTAAPSGHRRALQRAGGSSAPHGRGHFQGCGRQRYPAQLRHPGALQPRQNIWMPTTPTRPSPKPSPPAPSKASCSQ